MTRSRDTSNIFDPNSDIVNSSELNIAINTASTAAVAYTNSELGSIDLSSTIQTASAAAVSYLVDGAPGALNTLNELAAALNDDQNFATSILTTISSASAATLSAANTYTDNATPDLTPAIQAASAAAVAYTDQEVAIAIVSASAAAASYTDSELSTIDLTSTIVTASAAAASYTDNLINNFAPIITDINPDNVLGASGSAIYINGRYFKSGATVQFIDNSNLELNSSSVVFIDSNLVVSLTPILTASAAPYSLKLTNPDNSYYTLRNKISVGSAPVWGTTSGSLGTIYDIQRGTKTFTVSASDPEGTSVTYSLDSGNLPTGMTLTSGGAINGTPDAVANDTTYSFTVRATDGVNSSFRNFSILVKTPIVTTYSTVGNYTWTSPSELDKVRVLVVAGGGGGGSWVAAGGGAGGLIHNTNYSISPNTGYQVVVGDGGLGAINTGNMNFDTGGSRRSQQGQGSTFANLVAVGGGKGGSWTGDTSGSGGSGGGSSNPSSSPAGSGTAGQGYSGGAYGTSGNYPTGGGGGAGGPGAQGQNGEPGIPGNGGVGLAIDITGTSVYYAGGGAGGDHDSQYNTTGGLGGGGNGSGTTGVGGDGTNGLGGGGGGGGRTGGSPSYGGKGGSGVVIIRY